MIMISVKMMLILIILMLIMLIMLITPKTKLPCWLRDGRRPGDKCRAAR